MGERIQKSFRAMGTINTITVYRRADENALQKAVRHVLELDGRLSVFKPDSEASRINIAAGKGAVPISPDTFTLLQTAKKFSVLSGGAFSVTSRPLTALWAIGSSRTALPEKAEIEKTRLLVNDEDLILDEPDLRVMLKRRGQAIDLGGIAKGFAADEARRVLAENGVSNAVINLGGTVIAMGEPITVGIQHPGKDTGIPMGGLRLQNRAAVTSGNYERYKKIGGALYHHILDPASGAPAASGLCSVTVIGESAAELDALSTAMFVLGAEKGERLARRLGAESILVTEQMDVFCSQALRERFSLYPVHSNTRRIR